MNNTRISFPNIYLDICRTASNNWQMFRGDIALALRHPILFRINASLFFWSLLCPVRWRRLLFCSMQAWDIFWTNFLYPDSKPALALDRFSKVFLCCLLPRLTKKLAGNMVSKSTEGFQSRENDP